ncbi:MAG TPA: hypothetical protein VE621_10005 [Bryobacteraceae bacterium]|nr:hypothetical protein [Bryobacteraceae bacterium]
MVNPAEYVPRSYHPRISTYWWLARWPYLKFILRELSSIFVAWGVVLTLLYIRALARGQEDYVHLQQWLQTPLLVILNAISFLFVLFHAVTWFNLSSAVMPIRVSGKRLPGWIVAAPNYVACVVISAAFAWIVLRG